MESDKNGKVFWTSSFALIVITVGGVCSQHWADEGRLRDALMPGYNGQVRPALNVSVGLRFSLFAINQLDVPNQKLALSGWLTVTWEDGRLVWDPADYGNVTDIYDTEESFWRPQIIIDNAVDELGIISQEKLHIRAKHQGIMTWQPPGVLVTFCSVDVTYYPFDTQLCRVEVTSWSYTLSEVDLHAVDNSVDLEDYAVNGEWDVTGTWAERRTLQDEAETHSQIDFYVRLRRRSAYYVNTVLVPVVVLAVLSVLVFILPAESGKVGYSLTILLTYTVMLTLVSDLMPPTSRTTSVLSVYLTLVLVVGVLSCLLTMCVLVCHHHDPTPLPAWLVVLNTRALIRAAGWTRLEEKHEATTDTDANCTTDIDLDPAHSPDLDITCTEASCSTGIDFYPPHATGLDPPQYRDLDLTWAEVAEILDRVCWRVLGSGVLGLTAVVLALLAASPA